LWSAARSSSHKAFIIGCIAAFVGALGTQFGVSVLRGKAQFTPWRSHHVSRTWSWLFNIAVISPPILFVVGRGMLAAMTEHEGLTAASNGVGRLLPQQHAL